MVNSVNIEIPFSCYNCIQVLFHNFGKVSYSTINNVCVVSFQHASFKVVLYSFINFTEQTKSTLIDLVDNYKEQNLDYIMLSLEEIDNKINFLQNKAQYSVQLNERIGARKCTVSHISKTEATTFLNENHFYGFANGKFYFGLFYKTALVAVAVFSKGRAMKRLPQDSYSFELIRFASKLGYSINGGLSKLVNSFCKENKPADIMTYVDRRYGIGTSLEKLNFTLVGVSSPILLSYNSQTGKIKRANEFIQPMDHVFSTIGNYKFIKTC